MNDALRFRKISLSDIEERTKILNERESIDGITIEIPVSLTGSDQWFDKIHKDLSRRDFVLDCNGVSIGFSGIVNINYKDRNGEVYIFISNKNHGKGFGSKLLNLTILFAKLELNLRKITLYVTSSNAYATSFYEKNGFEREGLLKNHIWHRGKYRDRMIFSIFTEKIDNKEDYLYSYIS